MAIQCLLVVPVVRIGDDVRLVQNGEVVENVRVALRCGAVRCVATFDSGMWD